MLTPARRAVDMEMPAGPKVGREVQGLGGVEGLTEADWG